MTRRVPPGRKDGPATGEAGSGWRGDTGRAAMSDRRVRLSRWGQGLYVILVIAGTALLLHGRPPLTDKSLTWIETVLLLPGLSLYLPLLLLSGGIHWSLLPLWSQVPLWGVVNVCAYLGIPPAFRAMRRWRQDRSTPHGSRRLWQDVLLRPITMVLFGFGMLLVGLNGALAIWRGINGPTDIANTVLGPIGAIGLWTLAYFESRHGALRHVVDRGAPAWTRWAVPLVAIAGSVIGGVLVYGEMRILRWPKVSSAVLALTLSALTLALLWILRRLVRTQRGP